MRKTISQETPTAVGRYEEVKLISLSLRAWSIALFLVLFLNSNSSAQLLDRTDNQQWTEVQIAVPVTKAFDFNIIGGLRIGRDLSHPVDERIGVGFTFRAGKHVTVAPHYLHLGMQPFPRRRLWENRLVFPVTVRFNLGKFRLNNRNQIDRRLRNSGIDTTRYRNAFGVEHPVGPDKWGLSVFAADEVFYDWAVDRWARNRFAAGATKEFNKHLSQNFYYLRQNDRFGVPGDLNVIGTRLTIRLW